MPSRTPLSDDITHPALAQLAEAERAAALLRFRILRPHLEDGVPLARVARDQGLQLRTLQRWLRAYQQQGLAGLTRKVRRDRGRRGLPAALVCLIEGLALHSPCPSAATVHRQVVRVSEEQGWPVPSYNTVYAVMRRLDPALTTLAHEGTTAYANAFDLVYRREAGRPNEIWQADHTPLDLWVLDHRGPPAPG